MYEDRTQNSVMTVRCLHRHASLCNSTWRCRPTSTLLVPSTWQNTFAERVFPVAVALLRRRLLEQLHRVYYIRVTNKKRCCPLKHLLLMVAPDCATCNCRCAIY